MNKKIIGILICTLLIGTNVLSTSGKINMRNHQDINSTSLQVLPGIYFYQVDYLWTYSIYINSDTGLIVVNIDELKVATELESGYVNVYTSEGWVVNNLAIIQDSTTNVFPYPSVGVYFDLGKSGEVKSIGAYIEYTAEPYLSFSYSAALPQYPVYDTELNAEGGESPIKIIRPQPPDVDTLPGPGGKYIPFGITDSYAQKEHPNVECAKNQCVPMAYANNLQYLEDWYGIYVPYDHIIGLKEDNSLVGTLDSHINRTVTSRSIGKACGYTKALTTLVKLAYYWSLPIDMRHQGLAGNQDIEYENSGYISYGQGTKVQFDFIYDEVCKGSAIELALGWYHPNNTRDGGHMIQVVAAGYIYDIPFIFGLDDQVQISEGIPDGDSRGTQPQPPYGPKFYHLIDWDNDGLYNLCETATSNDTAEVEAIYVQEAQNKPPSRPNKPDGPSILQKDVVYNFSTITNDPNGDQVWYMWSWGDNVLYLWDGPFPSGQMHTKSHYWKEDGTYEIKVRAKDGFGAVSEWSYPKTCIVQKSHIYNKNPFVKFLNSYLNLVSILRQLLIKY